MKERIIFPINDKMKRFNNYFFPAEINEEFTNFLYKHGYISLMHKIIDFIDNDDVVNYNKICSMCKDNIILEILIQILLDKDKIDFKSIHQYCQISQIEISVKFGSNFFTFV